MSHYKPYSNYKGSGVDWLGQMPEHWNIKRFRFVFTESKERNGKTPVGSMLSVSGYRGVEIKEYEHEEKMRTDEELEVYRVVRPNQLAVNTMWLNHRGLGVSKHTGHVSPAYSVYNLSDETVPEFAHHLLRSDSYVDGYKKHLYGIRPNSFQIKDDDFRSLAVLLPPKVEQQAIAAFLDRETARIDALIEKKQRQIVLLKEKRQAIITQAVTKGLDPDVPKKDSGVEWLGEVPEHWTVYQIRHLVNTIGGGTPAKDNLAYWDGNIPWISPKDMKKDYISDAQDNITDVAVSESSANLIPVGSVLIVVRGMILLHSVPVALTEEEVTVNQDMKALVPGKTISGEYLLLLLKGLRDRILSLVDKSAHGTCVLPTEDFMRLAVALPNLPEQRRLTQTIIKTTSSLDSLISKSAHSIDLLQERRSALITAAITGQIDVRGE